MPEDPIFLTLPDVEKPIMRYMSIAKFRNLVGKSALHFTKASKFKDPAEGSHGLITTPIDAQAFLGSQTVVKSLREQLPLVMKEIVHVSCWTLNTEETIRMWDEFLGDDQGLAVISTWRDLANSLGGDIPIFGGMVEYIDHELIYIPEQQCLSPYIYKERQYEYEAELRVMALWHENSQGPAVGISPSGEKDLEIPVDLEMLISNIVLCPTANDELLIEVEKLVAGAGLNVGIAQSVFRKAE